MGYCTPSSPRTRAELRACWDTPKYIISFFPSLDLARSGARPMYSFSFWKVDSYSLVHSKSCAFFSSLNNGAHLLVALEMNWLSVATWPLRLYTSFFVQATSYFLRISFNTSVIYHKSQKFFRGYPKSTFERVEFHLIVLEDSKHLAQIKNMIGYPF